MTARPLEMALLGAIALLFSILLVEAWQIPPPSQAFPLAVLSITLALTLLAILRASASSPGGRLFEPGAGPRSLRGRCRTDGLRTGDVDTLRRRQLRLPVLGISVPSGTAEPRKHPRGSSGRSGLDRLHVGLPSTYWLGVNLPRMNNLAPKPSARSQDASRWPLLLPAAAAFRFRHD